VVVRLARENPSWGYTRLRDVIRSLGYAIGRTTIASIPTDHGIEPSPERRRRTSWRTFLKALNAYAERFVLSIKSECLDKIVPLGERHLRYAIREYVEHYHRERHHQGLESAIIAPAEPRKVEGHVRRRERLGGMLNYYYRKAA